MRLEVDAKMFIESVEQCGSKDLAENGDLSKGKESALTDKVPENEGISNMQPPTPSPSEEPPTSGMTNIQPISQTLPEINAGKAESTSDKEINSVQKGDDKQNPAINKETASNTSQAGACTFKLEKPKLPVFAGNVRDYAIFRSDFKHAVEAKYTQRDAITFLRTCLRDKPLELIKGIGRDYDAAWEYLDSIYGDPRFVPDTVTQDIVQFKALQEGEDARFCDLVHLGKRCYHTLKEVGLPSDMDNSHMLPLSNKRCALTTERSGREIWREKRSLLPW